MENGKAMYEAVRDQDQKALLCGNPQCGAVLTKNVKKDCHFPGGEAVSNGCKRMCVCSACNSDNCCDRGGHNHDKFKPTGWDITP